MGGWLGGGPYIKPILTFVKPFLQSELCLKNYLNVRSNCIGICNIS